MTLAELLAMVAADEKKVSALRDQMAASLAASKKDGITEEERAKHLAEFDALKPQASAARADLDRSVALRDEAQAGEAHAAREKQPTRPPLAQNPRQGVQGPAIVNRTMSRDRQIRLHGHRQIEGYANVSADRFAEVRQACYVSGLWVAATMYGNQNARSEYEEHYGDLSATLTTGSNGGAAYFVPEIVQTSIIELAEQFGVFRQFAEFVMMGSDSQSEPKWTGGLTAYFLSEGQAPTASDPRWTKVGLTAKNIGAFGKMSRNLNEDAIISVGAKWNMAAAVAFSEKEDDCGFNGDGTSTYGGIVGLRTAVIDSANAGSLYTATGHTTLATLDVADFENLMGMLPQYPGITPAFYCHKEVYHRSMGRLKRTAGGVTTAELTAGSPPEYGGYPVKFCQKMPKAASVTTGVTGILFGDMKLSSKFGERRQQTFESGLDGNDFSQQLMSLLSTERFDIVNHTIVDPRTSTDPGPMLGLKLG